MRIDIRALLIVFLCFAISAHAQEGGDAEWSWQTPEDFFEETPVEGEAIPEEDVMAPALDESLVEPLEEVIPDESTGEESWMWEEEAVEQDLSAPPPPPVRQPQKKGAAIDVSAYDEVLKENLDLRREADEALQAQEAIALDNQRLRQEVQDLEDRLQQLAVTLQAAKKSEPSADAETVDKALELENQLASMRSQNEQLVQEVADLKQVLADRPAAASPATGSDLYRDLETRNAQLKEKLSQTQAELGEALAAAEAASRTDDKHDVEIRQAWETRDELRNQLAQAEDEGKKHRRVVEKLLRQIPRMEQQMAGLTAEVETKDAIMAAREKEFQAMKLELERREHRQVQAEKMAGVLDDARRDISAVSKRQQRDMHYNMALVYAKEGKFRDAEREYLRALRLDPTDAESHYNLGILYDDEFNDKRRAAMHYRRYLKLNPHGQDADAVKGWLMQIQMKDG